MRALQVSRRSGDNDQVIGSSFWHVKKPNPDDSAHHGANYGDAVINPTVGTNSSFMIFISSEINDDCVPDSGNILAGGRFAPAVHCLPSYTWTVSNNPC